MNGFESDPNRLIDRLKEKAAEFGAHVRSAGMEGDGYPVDMEERMIEAVTEGFDEGWSGSAQPS